MIGCVMGFAALACGAFLASLGVYATGLAGYWAALSTAMGVYMGIIGLYMGGMLAYLAAFFMWVFG
jgi:hypothetical protein